MTHRYSRLMFILSVIGNKFVYRLQFSGDRLVLYIVVIVFNFVCFHSRYIEIFRSTEQQMMKSLMTSSRDNCGGRSSNNGNGNNNRMHPYERNGGNNFSRGNNNMRGRNQNMRNDFRRGNINKDFLYGEYILFYLMQIIL